MVGWLLTKRVSALLAISIRLMAMITAAIITARWSTMPSEKIASSTTICATTAQNFAPLRWVGLSLSFPSSRSLSSTVALNSRNKPPNSIIKSRALKLKS